MKSFYDGGRDGLSFGIYNGKEGYLSTTATASDDGLTYVRELGWCLRQPFLSPRP